MPRNGLPALTIPDQTGRTWLVTGATNGLGRAVAQLARGAGARVLFTARNRERGEALAADLGDARMLHLDLSDLDSVRAAAATVDGPIDVLVNNAGVMTARRSRNEAGVEMMMATNLLGPFALTNLLAPHLRDRVVIVGSNAHKGARLNPDDMRYEHTRWTPQRAYGASKLADMLWGLELGRRLAPRGVTVNLAHPGWALTNIQNQTGSAALDRVVTAACSVFAQSPEDAAQCVLTAAVGDVPAGSYVGPDGRMSLRGAPTLLERSSSASDRELAKELWSAAAKETAPTCPSRPPVGGVPSGAVRPCQPQPPGSQGKRECNTQHVPQQAVGDEDQHHRDQHRNHVLEGPHDVSAEAGHRDPA